MSELSDLKQKIHNIGERSKRTGDSLASFKTSFSGSAAEVNQILGGSTRKIDTELSNSLESAEKQIDQAVAALQEVATKASRYAQSL